MRTAKYEWYQAAAGGFRWRLKAANGEIVAAGEDYKTKAGVLRGIKAHRRASRTAVVVKGKLPR
ncbi:YegP family protein [Roseateles sp.]|uniref:YegP family protein n=1 Tax=Roseateles sp. TaxID=1971397 RepID=UPI003BA84215